MKTKRHASRDSSIPCERCCVCNHEKHHISTHFFSVERYGVYNPCCSMLLH